MLGSATLESVIGTVVIYILLSLICSVISEWISRLQGLRSTVLAHELKQMLGPNLMGAMGRNPLIRGTFENGRYPLYLPASTFSMALIQIGYTYSPGTAGKPGQTEVQPRWKGKDYDILEGLRQSATGLGPLQTRIEKWFDLSMEQASGRYKRQAQLYILVISGAMVAASDIDTIAVASCLYRSAVSHTPSYYTILWEGPQGPWPLKICGILLSWGAVSLGAPFWFDMLNKLVNLRQSGLPPDEDQRETAGTRFIAQ